MADVQLIPGIVNYTLTQGNTFAPVRVRINVGGTLVNGAITGGTYPDFSAYTAVMKIKTNGPVKTTIYTLTQGAGITLDSTGGIAPYLTSSQTALMELGDYIYSITLTSPASVKYSYIEGIITVKLDESA